MCQRETSFIPLTTAAEQTLGSGYGQLARLLFTPSNNIATINNLLSSGMTIDGSITTPPRLPKPSLVANLSATFNRPIHPPHPNLARMWEDMPSPAQTNLLNAHLTRQVIPDLLPLDAQMHLPTFSAMMGKNADVVIRTGFNPHLIMSLYYQFLSGYLTAYNQSQTLSLSIEDLGGRLSVIRIKDLENNASQGITFSFFKEDEPDNWSTMLHHRAQYQRVRLVDRDHVMGFDLDPEFYSATGRMEHSPGTIDWWVVFVARLIRTWADQGFPTDNIDFDSLEHYRPKEDLQLTDRDAVCYATANLAVADAYDPRLTKELVRATKLTPFLRQNTTAEMRRSLVRADHGIFHSRPSRQNSLANDELVDRFTRYMPVGLEQLKSLTRRSARSSASHIKQCTIIEPYERGRQGNNFMFLNVCGAVSFLRNSLCADNRADYDQLDYLYESYLALADGANPSTV